jgi:hypothetical protein
VAQGLQALDNYITVTEEDITDICANIRKPGGLVANPAYYSANFVAGVPQKIQKPRDTSCSLGDKENEDVKILLLPFRSYSASVRSS